MPNRLRTGCLGRKSKHFGHFFWFKHLSMMIAFGTPLKMVRSLRVLQRRLYFFEIAALSGQFFLGYRFFNCQRRSIPQYPVNIFFSLGMLTVSDRLLVVIFIRNSFCLQTLKSIYTSIQLISIFGILIFLLWTYFLWMQHGIFCQPNAAAFFFLNCIKFSFLLEGRRSVVAAE